MAFQKVETIKLIYPKGTDKSPWSSQDVTPLIWTNPCLGRLWLLWLMPMPRKVTGQTDCS